MKTKYFVYLTLIFLITLALVIGYFKFVEGDSNVSDTINEITDKTPEPEPEPEPTHPYSSLWLLENQLSGAVISLENSVSESEIKELASLNPDFVLLEIYEFWSAEKPYEPKKSSKNKVEDVLEILEENNLKTIIVPMTGPGKSNSNLKVFYKYDAQESWEMMLKDLVYETKDYENIIGWSVMGNPNPDTYFLEEDSTKFKTSMKFWNNLTNQYISTIRNIDSEKLILIYPLNKASPTGLAATEPLNYVNLAYAVNFMEPKNFINQKEPEFRYLYERDADEESYENQDLIELLSPAEKFQSRYKKPVIISRYGGVRYIPTMPEYIEDLIEIFEDNHFSFTYYAWNADEEYFLPYGINPYNKEIDPQSKAFSPILRTW